MSNRDRSALVIQKYDRISSTSTVLKEALTSGEVTAPSGVIARSQSAGRGRIGREWVSEEGGLYASLAVDVSRFPTDSLGLLPLWTGAKLSKWLRGRYGIGVRLKWPNDLLFAGAKLGGILCENIGTPSGQRIAIVGIGINGCNATASLNQNEGYRVTSLDQALGHSPWENHSLQIQEDAEDLLQSLFESWNTSSFDDQAVDQFGESSLPLGELVQVDKQSFARIAGVNSSGSLQLHPLTKPQEAITVSSVTSAPKWIYQDPDRWPLALCEVGHSHVSLRAYVPSTASDAEFTSEGQDFESAVVDLKNFLNKQQTFPPSALLQLYLASTLQGQEFEQTRKKLSEHFAVQQIRKRPVLLRTNVDLRSMGIDRLAQIEAALARHDGDRSGLIVVSCGTAITVDVVDGFRKHLGGWIVPGFQLALDALGQRLSSLPQISVSQHEPSRSSGFGMDTESAMIEGVRSQTLGLIERAKKLLQTEDNRLVKPTVVLTGGGASWLVNTFSHPPVYNPELINDGLRILALGGVENQTV